MSSSSSSPHQHRLYLNCPFDQKDEAKRRGAQWDAAKKRCMKDQVKRLGAKWDAAVKRWFVPANVDLGPFAPWLDPPKAASQTKRASQATEKAKESKPKAAASRATLPRVTADMTVAQLREECMARDPSTKGLSNKDKAWLLEHLGIGSVWIAANASASSSAAPPEKKASKNPPDKKKPKAAPKTSSTTQKTKSKQNPKPLDLHALPRVSTASMTLAQLSAELLARQPSARGLSSKPKDWFVQQLGEGSVWTTAPGVDVSGRPTVSASLTLAQLAAELLARDPTATGLSNKPKDWFLQRLGVDSVWMTAAASGNAAPTAAAPLPKKAAAVKKKDPPTKMSPVKAKPVAAKAAFKKKDPPTAAKKPAAKLTAVKKTVKKDPPAKAKHTATKKPTPPMKPTLMARRSSPIVFLPMSVKSAKVKKEVSSDTIRAPADHIRPDTASSLSHGDTLFDPLATQLIFEKPATQVAAPERTKGGLPAVSSKMTVAQLEEELLTRDPGYRGYSKMKSADFLAHLQPGSVWESHPATRSARDQQAAQLHSHSCQAHPHLLADAALLRCPPGQGTHKKRQQVARCECPQPGGGSWCQQTPYRSCEQCDFDLCRTCFELECLPLAEREAELDRRYDQIEKENEAAQRAWEEQQKAEAARRAERERQRKKEWEEQQKVAAARCAECERQRQKEWEEQQKAEAARCAERERQRQKEWDLKLFPKNIRDPSAAHRDENNKLEFTVWTSCGYDCDGWHSYQGPPCKEFNSSFATVEEANQRVGYVFWFENPWGLDLEEMHVENDSVNAKGFRHMEVAPDDYERWTVSVVPSLVFEYLD